MTGNVADFILQLLIQVGVKSIYGVSGDAIFPLLDAIARQDKIKFYSTAHESGAAFMASYEAKYTGRLAVCTATSGPGAVNLLNGLADAYFDKAPVLAITGQVATGKIGTNAKQFIKQDVLFSSVSSYSETLVSPEAALPVWLEAIQTAVNKRTVSHISIPVDIFSKPVDFMAPSISHGSSKVFGTGISAEIEQALFRLNVSKKLLIVIGCREKNIVHAIETIAEKRNAGILTAQQAKGIVPDQHSRVIGGIGEGYQPSLVEKADCILLAGQAPYEIKYLPVQVPIIQVATNSEELHFSCISSGLTGSIGSILHLLAERLENAQGNQSWVEEIYAEKQQRKALLAQDAINDMSPIHPARVVASLEKVIAENAAITLDIGSFMHWFDRGFQAKRQAILISAKWRSMGSAVPAAIAIAVAEPDMQVVALTGDGGFLMSMGEITTAVHYKLPVKVVVFSNGSYNLEEQKMVRQGLQSLGNEVSAPDFAKFAQSCGAQGFNIDRPDNLEEVLSEALNSTCPAVVGVCVSNIPLPSLR